MTKDEAVVLTDALAQEGRLSFPVSHVIGGLICGAVYSTKRKHNGNYKLTGKRRLLLRFNSAYRNILEFIRFIGFENIDVVQTIEEESIKSKLLVTVAKGRNPNWKNIQERITEYYRK